MRSGLIAQKLGMTRIYTDEGQQVPVTVLKADNCQVVARRRLRSTAIPRSSLAPARPRSSA